MAPVLLNYDGDGTVTGGHTVNELATHGYSVQPRATMDTQDSTPADFPGLVPVQVSQGGERHYGHQQLHSHPPDRSTYHQHSLTLAPPGPDYERAHSVQPPPFMQRSEQPPRAPRGQSSDSAPYVTHQQPQFARNPRETIEYSGYGPTERHGYVRGPNHAHGFHAQSFAPPPQTHPSQVYYEPAGYQRGPETFAYQHQQSIAPHQHGYIVPHPGWQAPYETMAFPQPPYDPQYRASYHPGSTFQLQHAPHQQQHQFPHHDRRNSSVSSRHTTHHLPTAGQHDLRTAPAPELRMHGKDRNKAGSERKSSRVTSEQDELPVVRNASIAELSNVENVFFRSSRPDAPKVSEGDEDDEPLVEGTKFFRRANIASKQTKEKSAPTMNAVRAPAQTASSKRGRKKDPAALLGRCKDCKKRHKKCKHLSKSNIEPDDGAGEGILTMAAHAGKDTHENLPVQGGRPSQSTGQPLVQTQSGSRNADILAFVPDEGIGGDSLSQSLADFDPDISNEAGEGTEIRFDDFLRSQSPQDDELVVGDRGPDEHSPALAAANFLNKLHAQLYDTNPLAIDAFHQDANRYKTAILDEQEFYVRTYKLLRRANASNLLADFVKCLPHRWEHTQISWLNDQAELEMAKEAEILADNVQIVPQESMPKARRKRRPKAAFRASDSLELIDAVRKKQGTAPDRGLSQTVFEDATPPGSPRSPPYAKSLDELPDGPSEDDLASPRKQSRRKASKSKHRPSKATSVKRSRKASSTTPGTFKIKKSSRPKKVQFGHLFASEVEHVGPCYGTRREVLRRSTNPYVHSLCGQGFPHPQEVRAHHKAKKCHDDSTGRAWDEHPSCKADYPELNYTKVRDGYVILDQASWDKLAAAVATGEKEPNRFRKRELKEKDVDQTSEVGEGDDLDDSEDDAEYEVDEEFETAIPPVPYSWEGSAASNQMNTASAITPAAAPNPRKRAASGVGGRAGKRIIVKAGSDETAPSDTPGVTKTGTPSKNSIKKPVIDSSGSAGNDDSPAGLIARASALGLRARF